VLFVVTICVIVLVVLMLLHWIDHLSRLGTLAEAMRRVENALTSAMNARGRDPYLGGRPLNDPDKDIPSSARPIGSVLIGYVQHVDVQALSELAQRQEGRIFVTALPGTFVDPYRPLAWVVGIDDDKSDVIRTAFTVDRERTFDQDPRFGFIVLAEIAIRALSPAVNDPGTAIDVIGRGVRVLSIWSTTQVVDDGGPKCPRVMVPPVRLGELFDDLFVPIARDGAAFFEVHVRLQKGLLALASIDARYAHHAARNAQTALARSEAKLALEDEKSQLREIAAQTQRKA
jgi:uncharacterized membrane protein